MARSLPALLLAATVSLSLGACVSNPFPGIPMEQGAADPKLQELAKSAARHFNPYAELELGRRYEYGIGVPVNWRIAILLYSQASFNSTGMYANYRRGLPEAKERYRALRAKMVAAGMQCIEPGWNNIVCKSTHSGPNKD